MDSTLVKGLTILEKLLCSESPCSVSALAAEFNLPKSNIHRTLAALVETGFVSKNATGSYLPTLKTWELGRGVLSRQAIYRTAIVFMHTLFHEIQETVNLIVLDGDDSLYINQISSSTPIRASSTIGERAPAILTVSGRAMLAFTENPAKRARDLYANQKIPKPPMKLNELLEELEQIRHDGYGKAASVWRPGINSLAAPILNGDNKPVGAIAVAGPKERFTEEKMQAVVPALLNTCTGISRALGI